MSFFFLFLKKSSYFSSDKLITGLPEIASAESLLFDRYINCLKNNNKVE